ncbi:Protein SERAC1 [Lamellibrachia satsuma]|nr:Protein SERAC1 [Lamellibrachia satsuma]
MAQLARLGGFSVHFELSASNGDFEWLGPNSLSVVHFGKDWLAEDVPGTRIVSVEYETQISGWTITCPVSNEQRTLHTRSKELLTKLRQAGVGERPVIWVGHSMGGLLIKQMLLMAREDPESESIVENSRGIVFYSVPNKGTPLANTKRAIKYIISPTVEVEELKQGSKPLLALHRQFQQLVQETAMPVLSFGEGSQVKLPLHYKTIMVPRDSSDPGVGDFFLMENLDHLDICKPRSRSSVLYHMTEEFIRVCVERPGTPRQWGRHSTALGEAAMTETSM